MRLVENNWGKFRCPKCDSVISDLTEEDILINCDNEKFTFCPICDSRIWLTDNVVVDKILKGEFWHR